MSNAARIPAPQDLGETTIRMVVEFLPDACQPGGDGTQLLTPEVLQLAYAIKGLRGQQAGERTIRRVLQGPEKTELLPGKIIPISSRRRNPEIPAPEPRLSEALGELEIQQSRTRRALADVDAALDRLGDRLDSSARADRYDAFLGSLSALGALSRRRSFPLGPGDLA